MFKTKMPPQSRFMRFMRIDIIWWHQILISYSSRKKKKTKLAERKLGWKERRAEIVNGLRRSYRCNRKNNVELDRSSRAAINEFQSTGLCFMNRGSAEAFRTFPKIRTTIQ